MGVERLSWMVGLWRGGDGAVQYEERWEAPLGPGMIGNFRMIRSGEVDFYELLAIDGAEPMMRIRHFGPGLVPWPEDRFAVDLALIRSEPGFAEFGAPGFRITYLRQGDILEVCLLPEGREPIRFAFERVS